ncbi:hypothetical protein QYF61_003857 [Mycteria americana]|uniref:Uncharacterized protein n=1 Tax=Mycteria americana TaxID=33587 RepID=A0AAN7RYV2_MYCAM|nr:hypothetical protein QYF61_003857 [Mycteria americana]
MFINPTTSVLGRLAVEEQVWKTRSWKSLTWITGRTSEDPVCGKIPGLFRSNGGRLSVSRQSD